MTHSSHRLLIFSRSSRARQTPKHSTAANQPHIREAGNRYPLVHFSLICLTQGAPESPPLSRQIFALAFSLGAGNSPQRFTPLDVRSEHEEVPSLAVESSSFLLQLRNHPRSPLAATKLLSRTLDSAQCPFSPSAFFFFFKY